VEKNLSSFLSLIAEEIGCEVENIVDFELSAVDTNTPRLFGLHKEFVASGRLDNMLSSLCGTHAICEVGDDPRDALPTSNPFLSMTQNDPREDNTVNILFCFDHEEIGSVSDQGAEGTLAGDALERIFYCLNGSESRTDYKRCLRRSFRIRLSALRKYMVLKAPPEESIYSKKL
jgi:aspartyl aminopeptidase